MSANEKAASGCTPKAAHEKPPNPPSSMTEGASRVKSIAWRPLASLAGYGDERDDSDTPPPKTPPDRESETVEERKRRTGYDGAFERPERWAPSERPDEIV